VSFLGKIRYIAVEQGYDSGFFDGSNATILKDFRPGMKAKVWEGSYVSSRLAEGRFYLKLISVISSAEFKFADCNKHNLMPVLLHVFHMAKKSPEWNLTGWQLQNLKCRKTWLHSVQDKKPRQPCTVLNLSLRKWIKPGYIKDQLTEICRKIRIQLLSPLILRGTEPDLWNEVLPDAEKRFYLKGISGSSIWIFIL